FNRGGFVLSPTSASSWRPRGNWMRPSESTARRYRRPVVRRNFLRDGRRPTMLSTTLLRWRKRRSGSKELSSGLEDPIKHLSELRRHPKSPHRPGSYPLCLEALEDRLPPGDWLLAALLGSSLLGPSLLLRDAGLGAPEITRTEGPSADHRATSPGEPSLPEA